MHAKAWRGRGVASSSTLSQPSCCVASGGEWHEHRESRVKHAVETVPPSTWQSLHPALQPSLRHGKEGLASATRLGKETLARDALRRASPPSAKRVNLLTRWLRGPAADIEQLEALDELESEEEAEARESRLALLLQCLKHGEELRKLLRSLDPEGDGFTSSRDFFRAVRSLRLDRTIISRVRERRHVSHARVEQYTATAGYSQPVAMSLFAAFEVSSESGQGRGFLRYDELDDHLRRYGAARRRDAIRQMGKAAMRRVDDSFRRVMLRARAVAFVRWVERNEEAQRQRLHMARAKARLCTPKQAAAFSDWRQDWAAAMSVKRALAEEAERLAWEWRKDAAAKAALPLALPNAPRSVQMALDRELERHSAVKMPRGLTKGQADAGRKAAGAAARQVLESVYNGVVPVE